MKARDLTIGNWYHSVKFNKPVQLTAEDIAELVKRSDGAKITYCIHEMFEPIELTEDWMIKFEEPCEMGDSVFELFTHKGDFIIYKELVKYVHQYQDIYYDLTGEELPNPTTK